MIGPKFQAFLDTVRMPVFVLVIIAAPFVVYVNRSYFEQFFTASTPTTSSVAPASAAPMQTATTDSTSSPQATSPTQPSAQISVDDPSALPTSVTTGQIVSFSFTITNTAGISATYPYKVYVQWNTGEQDVIDENLLTLGAGQSQSIPEELKFEQASDKGEIFIVIQNTNQTLQFALPAAK